MAIQLLEKNKIRTFKRKIRQKSFFLKEKKKELLKP